MVYCYNFGPQINCEIVKFMMHNIKPRNIVTGKKQHSFIWFVKWMLFCWIQPTTDVLIWFGFLRIFKLSYKLTFLFHISLYGKNCYFTKGVQPTKRTNLTCNRTIRIYPLVFCEHLNYVGLPEWLLTKNRPLQWAWWCWKNNYYVMN